MIQHLNYVKDTIHYRENDITNNQFETNNLLIDDILMALGYNRKRDRGVKELQLGNLNWSVSVDGDNRFMVYVYGYNSEIPDTDSIEEALYMCENNDYDILLVTDGYRLSIYNKHELSVEIESIFEDDANKYLVALSKDSWNKELFDNNKIKLIDIQSALEGNLDNIVNKFKKYKNLENAIENIIDIIKEFNINTDSNGENGNIDYELKEENEHLKELIKRLETERDTLNNENSGLKETIEAINIKNNNHSINESNEQLQLALEEIESLKTESNDLKIQLNNALSNVKENSINDDIKLEIQVKDKEIEELNARIQGVISEKDNEIEELKNRINTISNSTESTEKFNENAHRSKLVELTETNQKLTYEIINYKNKIEELQKIIDGEEDKHLIMAKQLLDAVEDNPNLARTYVGVVNSKLFQIQDIEQFVGNCLQELYSVVNFRLMHLLFDGDIFKLIQPAIRNDLLINNKSYDIDLDGIPEDEIMNKLESLFSRFDDVVFKCKVIGNIQVKALKINVDDIDEELDDNNYVQLDNFNKDVKTDSIIDDIIEGSNYILKIPFSKVSTVLWMDNNPIIKLKAIGDDRNTFRILDYDLVKTCLYSIVAMSKSCLNSVNKFRAMNLKPYSQLISDEEQDSYVKILDTNYYINSTDYNKFISAIINLAEQICELDLDNVYMYFESKYSINEYSAEKVEFTELVINESYDRIVHCIISGAVIDSLNSIDDPMEMYHSIVNQTIAVKTEYMNTSLKTNEDLVRAIKIILSMSDSYIDDNEFVNNINDLFPNNCKVILDMNDEKSENAIDIVINDNMYFIDTIPEYIKMFLIYTVHKYVTGNNSMDIRLEINGKFYNAYVDDTITSNSAEYVHGKLFLESIGSNRFKILN